MIVKMNEQSTTGAYCKRHHFISNASPKLRNTCQRCCQLTRKQLIATFKSPVSISTWPGQLQNRSEAMLDCLGFVSSRASAFLSPTKSGNRHDCLPDTKKPVGHSNASCRNTSFKQSSKQLVNHETL